MRYKLGFNTGWGNLRPFVGHRVRVWPAELAHAVERKKNADAPIRCTVQEYFAALNLMHHREKLLQIFQRGAFPDNGNMKKTKPKECTKPGSSGSQYSASSKARLMTTSNPALATACNSSSSGWPAVARSGAHQRKLLIRSSAPASFILTQRCNAGSVWL